MEPFWKRWFFGRNINVRVPWSLNLYSSLRFTSTSFIRLAFFKGPCLTTILVEGVLSYRILVIHWNYYVIELRRIIRYILLIFLWYRSPLSFHINSLHLWRFYWICFLSKIHHESVLLFNFWIFKCICSSGRVFHFLKPIHEKSVRNIWQSRMVNLILLIQIVKVIRFFLSLLQIETYLFSMRLIILKPWSCIKS